MTSRAAKRARTMRTKRSTFSNTIPLDDDFNVIHTSEGAIRNVGGVSGSSRKAQSSQHVEGTWEHLSVWEFPDDENLALDPDGTLFDQAVDADVMEEPVQVPPVVKKKKKRSMLSQRPHVVWKEAHRQTYLDEILRWAGRGDYRHGTGCLDCLSKRAERVGSPEYRCRECFLPDLTCRECCLKRHRMNPFHRIERWDGEKFVEISLRSLGLKIQLNHSGAASCDNPIPCHKSMLILHINGIHSVDISYCGCTRAIPHHLQLLRRRLYPASQQSVKTCGTFELLQHLHKLALTTKASTYDFYRCLEQQTTNIGINVPKTRYRALFRMILQWRHLQMLKWGGRGHDIGGVAGTGEGELAVKCPTCPHPGINIPDDWANASDGQKFLYQMILCMDANFRLKNQLVSNYSQDPGLGIGWSYMVPRALYEAYVLSRANDADVSTCVGFQALAKANTKFSKGLRYTGVGLVCCGRSEMVMPLGIGNLQKGERYANMDYIFGLVLKAVAIATLLISYDIACQWFINLFKRMTENWPDELKEEKNINIISAIPKLHIAMHERGAHEAYNFNYIPGVGLTDGECPERIWAPHNILGNATKTQGPGSRQDTLDDHFGAWNWAKYTSMGTTLLRRYRNAVADRNLQRKGFEDLTASLELTDPGVVKKWEIMCMEWECDEGWPKTKKNPYHSGNNTISEAQVKKDLSKVEEEYLNNGGVFPHETTGSKFIGIALDIEETQRRIRRMAIQGTSTVRKEGTITEHRNALMARIRNWEELLPLYLPGLLQYKIDHPEEAEVANHAEDIKLWLPSAIPNPERLRITIPPMIEIEGQFRMAQMNDALRALRQVLKLKSRMVQFKNKNIRGQRQGTRSRAVIDRVHERARNAAAKYRAARVAHLELAGPGEWEKEYQVLNDSDIRGYQDPDHIRKRVGRRGIWEDGQTPVEEPTTPTETAEFELFTETRPRRDGMGQTRRTLSWIWTVKGGDREEDKGDDGFHVEWAKNRARAKRTEEEVLLLKEEMRRALVFIEWKADWWRKRQLSRPGLSSEMLEAVSAYALGQANIQDSLASHFRMMWMAPLQSTEVLDEDGDSDTDTEDDDEEEGVEDVAEDEDQFDNI